MKDLKKWHPISLLNVDYKICSKVITLHLSNILDLTRTRHAPFLAVQFLIIPICLEMIWTLFNKWTRPEY